LRGAEFPGMNEPFMPQTPMVTSGSRIRPSLLATIRSQAQASINPPAMHLREFRRWSAWRDCASAGDLQIDLLFARKAAMGVGFREAAPVSDRGNRHPPYPCGGPQIVPAEKCGPLRPRMMTLIASSCTA